MVTFLVVAVALPNVTYLAALYLLLIPLWHLVPRTVPIWAFWSFAIWSVGLESWHVIEHIVIITNVIRHGGCPRVQSYPGRTWYGW